MGKNALMIKSFRKHGIGVGDTVAVYFREKQGEPWTKTYRKAIIREIRLHKDGTAQVRVSTKPGAQAVFDAASPKELKWGRWFELLKEKK